MNWFSQQIMTVLLLASMVAPGGCEEKQISPDSYGIFSSQDESTVLMNGVIGGKTPQHWDNYIKAFPNTDKIIMKACPGSKDDEANLEAARKVRLQKVAIHLPADAEIASGAVDFYLAGTIRSRDMGSKIGVHSWSGGLFGKEATDFPNDHENHQPYIEYYKEMGFSQADAEAFYFFTIQSAKAKDIHWMTEEEIAQYKLVKP